MINRKTLFLYFLLPFIFSSCQLSQKKTQAANHHIIGVSLLKKCEGKAGLFHLKKAVSYQPNNPLIHYSLGSVYFLIKEYQLAKKEFEKVLAIEPSLTEARVNLALVLIKLNQVNQALKELKKAKSDLTYTKIDNILSYEAYAYFKQKKYQLALKKFQTVYERSKENGCLNYTHLGKANFYLKNYDESKKILKQAVGICQDIKGCRLEPHLYEEHYFLGRIYTKSDIKQAKYHFKIFIKRTNSSSRFLEPAKEELKRIDGI